MVKRIKMISSRKVQPMVTATVAPQGIGIAFNFFFFKLEQDINLNVFQNFYKFCTVTNKSTTSHSQII